MRTTISPWQPWVAVSPLLGLIIMACSPPFIDPTAMPCWWTPGRAKQLPMAATARVIRLCACVRYWPGRGMGWCMCAPCYKSACIITWPALKKQIMQAKVVNSRFDLICWLYLATVATTFLSSPHTCGLLETSILPLGNIFVRAIRIGFLDNCIPPIVIHIKFTAEEGTNFGQNISVNLPK